MARPCGRTLGEHEHFRIGLGEHVIYRTRVTMQVAHAAKYRVASCAGEGVSLFLWKKGAVVWNDSVS